MTATADDVASDLERLPRFEAVLARVVGSPRRRWLAWLTLRVIGVVNLIVARAVIAYDVDLYGRWAHELQSGLVPFRDFNVEYPPGILGVLVLPAPTPGAYFACFLLAALVVDALVLRALSTDSRPVGIALWIAAPMLLGGVFWARLDIFVAAALVLVTRSARRGQWNLAAVAVMAAAAVKLWPLVLLPALLPLVPRRRRVAYLAFASTGALIVVMPLVALGAGGGLRWMLDFHSQRGIEVEALVAVPLHVAKIAGFSRDITVTHGTFEFDAESSRVVARIADAGLAVACTVVVAVCARARRAIDPGRVVLVVVITVIVFAKVLSPQYMVCVVAGAACVVDDFRASARRHLAVTLSVALLSTQLLWPVALPWLVAGDPYGYVIGAIHAATVLILAVSVARTSRRDLLTRPVVR